MDRFILGAVSFVVCGLAGCADPAGGLSEAPPAEPAALASNAPTVVVPPVARFVPVTCPTTQDARASDVDALARQFDQRQKCRLDEARQVRAEFRAGKMDRTTAAAAMIVLRGYTRQDVTQTRAVLRRMAGGPSTVLTSRLRSAEEEASRLGKLDG